MCVSMQDKHISQYYIQRDECLFFVVLSNMVIHGYLECETVVSKRIFADKCASEYSHFILFRQMYCDFNAMSIRLTSVYLI